MARKGRDAEKEMGYGKTAVVGGDRRGGATDPIQGERAERGCGLGIEGEVKRCPSDFKLGCALRPQGGRRSDREKDGQNSVVGKTATLELKPAQAELLARARQSGTISLALRSMNWVYSWYTAAYGWSPWASRRSRM